MKFLQITISLFALCVPVSAYSAMETIKSSDGVVASFDMDTMHFTKIHKGNRILGIVIEYNGKKDYRYLWVNCEKKAFLVEDRDHNEIANGYLNVRVTELPQYIGNRMCKIKEK